MGKKAILAVIALIALIAFAMMAAGAERGLIKIALPHNNVKSAAAKAIAQGLQEKGAVNELALEAQYAREDLEKDAAYLSPPITASVKPRLTLRDRLIRILYPVPRVRIPPGVEPAYPIGLSPADRANPLFESVDMSKYQGLQREHGEIFAAMVWADAAHTEGRSIIYSQSRMHSLAHYIALLETGQPFPFSAPSIGRDVPAARNATLKLFTEEEALNMYIPHLAVSLYVEANHLVPWSMAGYGSAQLSLLLDGRKFINYEPERSAYRLYMTRENGGGLQGLTDWNPFYSYEFLLSNGMVMPTQEGTIYALTQWMREHLYHEASADAYSHRLAYGYNGSYPVDKILNPPSGEKSWTAGCSGTTSLYKAMLYTINIPVSTNFTLGGHTGPVFPTTGIALIHGDDPYGLFNKRGAQEVPVNEIFVPISRFYETNHAEPEPYMGYAPNQAEMAGWLHSRGVGEKAYYYMAYRLLNKRVEDVVVYLPRDITTGTLEEWWGYDGWRPIFSAEERNAMFVAMDAEIMRIGDGDYSAGSRRVCSGLIPRPDYC